jgi:hypothetical protein
VTWCASGSERTVAAGTGPAAAGPLDHLGVESKLPFGLITGRAVNPSTRPIEFAAGNDESYLLTITHPETGEGLGRRHTDAV